MALAAVFALAAAWPCAAPAAGPQECGLIGTWYGSAGPLSWLGVHTPGSKGDRNGEMVLHWVKNSLITEGTLTDGHGVWEQTGKGQYKYTWYAYVIGTLNDGPLYSVRVSGTAENADCDTIYIHFTFEMFDGFVLPQDMSEDNFVGSIVDDAYETRLPLTTVTVTPPEP